MLASVPRLARLPLAAALLALLLLASRRFGLQSEGPRILQSPLVREAEPAPAATADSNAAAAFAGFKDARGSYSSLRFPSSELGEVGGGSGDGDGGGGGGGRGEGVEAPYVNVVFTRAGFKRSGDLHACEQLNGVLFGRAELTQVYKGGRSRKTVLRGGDQVRIPAFVPHLYDFVEDTLMTETWRNADGSPCPFKAWLYAPLRRLIPPASTNKTFAAGLG